MWRNLTRLQRVVEVTHWNLKGCPRCGGDTFIDRDLDGWYESCLMCGYSGSVPRVASPAAKAVAEPHSEAPDTPSASGVGLS